MVADRHIYFTTSRRPGAVCLTVTGELDLCTHLEFEAVVRRLSKGHGELRVDLSRLDFLDAAGLHALERAVQASGTARRMVVEPDLQPQVRRFSEIAGTDVFG